MMLSNVDSRENGTGGGVGSSNGQLLHDIEALGKALSLTKARSKSAGRTRISEARPYSSKEDISSSGSDLLLKGKKSSTWNWKKPLKALTHIRDRKFNCCFYVHVHSIEGLPSYFNNLGLCVQWKRKDAVWKTRPSRVDSGFVDFKQTFKHQCSVYGHKSGQHLSSKYESILYLLYVSVVGSPGIDIGKHWVDITNVLPLTLEELEDPKSSGKWTTSFKLEGKAKGATLNISIGYSVMGNGFIGSKRFTDALFPLNSDKDGLYKLERVSVPSLQEQHGSLSSGVNVPSDVNLVPHRSSQYIDAIDNLSNADLQFSRSIKFLYTIIDEVKLGTSEKVDSFTESVVSPHTEHDSAFVSAFVSAEANNENELDDLEFSIIEQGIEILTKEQPRSEESIDLISDGHDLETLDERVDVNDTSNNKEGEDYSNGDLCDKLLDGFVLDDCTYKEQHAGTQEEPADEVEKFGDLLLPESVDSMDDLRKFIVGDSYTEVKSLYNAPRMERSSLDDLTESVANDFLHMLETDTASYHPSSDSEPGSPRERLLRQFEKEALASGSFLYDVGLKEEMAEAVSAAPALTVVGDASDDFEFLPISEISERKQKKESPSLICKRKAKMLENIETEALMHEWGLNEMAFVNSPRTNSGGFGSPIYRPNEEPMELPPLAEGLGPVLPTQAGGYLRSMNPKIFRNAKSSGSLIMQVSRPVVLPAEMGTDIMDILKQFAAVGIDKFSFQADRLMPLDDISQKAMQDLTRHAADTLEVSQRMEFSKEELQNKQLNDDGRGGLEYLNNKKDELSLSLSLSGGEVGLECMSPEDLSLLAMSEIEALLIEGLRIQSGISGEETPAYEMPYVNSGEPFRFGSTFENKQQSFVGDTLCNSDGLMRFCIPLDEWLKLDAGLISDEDHIDQHTLEVLAAHHAKCTELIRGSPASDTTWWKSSGEKCGLLGDKFTEAIRIQLRDPFRNYEPVGIPIVALVQVERMYFSLKSDLYDTFNHGKKDENCCEVINDIIEDEDEDGVQGTSFRIIEVHVAGLNAESHKKRHWGSTTQQQSGCRWLLSNGMNKAMKGLPSKSKAIVKSTPVAARRMSCGDTLWSISSNVSRTEAKWEVSAAANSTMRNPDVIFQEELVLSR